ncbi:MAG: terminase small subunit [Steroidobacteraceae bacterium]|jgi:hypothetical protein
MDDKEKKTAHLKFKVRCREEVRWPEKARRASAGLRRGVSACLECRLGGRRIGYKGKRADRKGCAMLAKPQVRAAVDAAIAKSSERTGITQDSVLNEIARVAYADSRKGTQWGPDGVKLIDSSELSGSTD